MTLFIDTHYEDLVIITYNSDGIIEKEVIKNERENSKIIMPTIEVILHNQKPSDIVLEQLLLYSVWQFVLLKEIR